MFKGSAWPSSREVQVWLLHFRPWYPSEEEGATDGASERQVHLTQAKDPS